MSLIMKGLAVPAALLALIQINKTSMFKAHAESHTGLALQGTKKAQAVEESQEAENPAIVPRRMMYHTKLC